MIFYSVMNSPIEELIIASFQNKICFLEFSGNRRARIIENKISDKLNSSFTKGTSPVLKISENQLKRYFAGKLKEFTVPLYLVGTDFQKRVWRQLVKIPFGQTVNYGALANQLGIPGGARAIGQAVGNNPVSIILPCHRVIGKNGSLTGFGGGIRRKKWLLKHEGAL